MNFRLTGIGIWGPGLSSWNDVRTLVASDADTLPDPFEAPRPDAIPARERRRAGLTINLAVEVMHQACAMSGVSTDRVATVFASAMGDTDVTDYMCRKLASEERLLSPTKFHNSVHNAPSGYWSISAVNRQPSSFVGGFRDSFACGLLEAAALGLADGLTAGLAAYDIANRPPFRDVLAVEESLGLALILEPAGTTRGWPLTQGLETGSAVAPMPRHPALARLAAANPMGTGLALLEALALGKPAALVWPLGAGTRLRAQLSPWSATC
jgi:hypothetical protein